ncbi:MAG: hypothetical protein M3404_06645 [Actinomycetota bacterium]|nr:hypothetical protein [Actinomycetota bacterium]
MEPILGDGRPLLLVVAGSLLFSGGFALFLAATGEFLPHDIHYLGMSAANLCQIASCRIVEFMVHDRAAFGGTLAGLGVLYVWLTVFPLGNGEPWAWWVWLVSSTAGFASFLAYLGYGYLDTWHGAGTLLLLPVFVLGMVRARGSLNGPLHAHRLWPPPGPAGARSSWTWGRALLLLGAAATAIGGLTILWVGVGDTFVPEDLEFMELSAEQLRDINPRLVPLMAHDRAGFGGGVFTMGLTTLLCLWCAPPSRHLHQAVALAGGVSLTAALGVHAVVGYTDLAHLVPALGAALMLVVGLALARRPVARHAGNVRHGR